LNKDFGEGFADLLESSLDGFILSLIENVDEFLNRFT